MLYGRELFVKFIVVFLLSLLFVK